MAGSTNVVPEEPKRRSTPLAVTDLETIGRVHVSAMRYHQRKAALAAWEDGRWRETPDWRLDRQVIRLGLYLKERAHLVPGDRVAIVSPLRRESLLAEWSAAVQGAVAFALEPDLPVDALAEALGEIAPRIAYVSGPSGLERLEAARSRAPGLETVIAFEGDRPRTGALLSEVLDLGGTLDTPERAGAFRARAREVSPDAAALGAVTQRPGHRPELRLLTHREVTARLRRLWSTERARPGDVVYLAAVPPTLPVRIAVLAFVGDGTTKVVLGTAGRELDEVAELAPDQIVAPPSLIALAMARAEARRSGDGAVHRWIDEARRLAALAGLRKHGNGAAAAAFGARLRRVRATLALDVALAARLRDDVAVDVDLGGE